MQKPQKVYKNGNYMVEMWKANFRAHRKTHKVLILSIPSSEGNYPAAIRRRRMPNIEAEQAYNRAVAWINARA